MASMGMVLGMPLAMGIVRSVPRELLPNAAFLLLLTGTGTDEAGSRGPT